MIVQRYLDWSVFSSSNSKNLNIHIPLIFIFSVYIIYCVFTVCMFKGGAEARFHAYTLRLFSFSCDRKCVFIFQKAEAASFCLFVRPNK